MFWRASSLTMKQAELSDGAQLREPPICQAWYWRTETQSDKLYDRTSDQIALDEIGRFGFENHRGKRSFDYVSRLFAAEE